MDRKWWTLIVACLGTFMLLIDITVVNVALPDIQSELHASFSDLQWVDDAYEPYDGACWQSPAWPHPDPACRRGTLDPKDRRVLRGGSWDALPPQAHGAFRAFALLEGVPHDGVGFRCAKDLPP